MIRILTLTGGLLGALALSQFPAFSQQYLQRLSGAVDELGVLAVEFDRSARSSGLTRDEALAQLGGTAFEEDLRGNLTERLARYDRLQAAHAALTGRGPLMRLVTPWHFADADIARATRRDFEMGMQFTLDGVICILIGYVLGRGAVGGAVSVIGWSLRRRGGARQVD